MDARAVAPRVALVTGAAQGIGAAIALALARDGYDLLLGSSRSSDALEATLAAVRATGRRAEARVFDLRDTARLPGVVEEAADVFGGLGLLVNNAGVPLRKPALEITPADWERVMATNLTGTFFLTQAVGRVFANAGQPGAVITVSSTHALVGMADRAAYGIAKAGIVQMTRMLAIEWAPLGIRVNAVAPGRVDTTARAGSFAQPGYLDTALARIPMGRLGTVEEVAAAVAYLARPEAAYVTGQVLVLDGGVTAQ